MNSYGTARELTTREFAERVSNYPLTLPDVNLVRNPDIRMDGVVRAVINSGDWRSLVGGGTAHQAVQEALTNPANTGPATFTDFDPQEVHWLNIPSQAPPQKHLTECEKLVVAEGLRTLEPERFEQPEIVSVDRATTLSQEQLERVYSQLVTGDSVIERRREAELSSTPLYTTATNIEWQHSTHI